MTSDNPSATLSDMRQVTSWTRNMLRKHPALLLSGLYFIASLIGLIYSWNFMRFFHINIFRYAEISDFLLASLKEPFTWLLAILAVVLLLLDNAMSRRVEARGPGRMFRWYGSKRYRQTNYLALVGVVALFLHTFASLKEKDIRQGNAEFVSVELSDSQSANTLILLGTTGRFIFFYDHLTEQVFIHPHESIRSITKSSPNRRK